MHLRNKLLRGIGLSAAQNGRPVVGVELGHAIQEASGDLKEWGELEHERCCWPSQGWQRLQPSPVPVPSVQPALLPRQGPGMQA